MTATAHMDSAAAAGTRRARVEREGDRLVFGGALDRDGCAALWKQVQPLLGDVRMIDLEAVIDVDSAGLALLSEISARNPGAGVVGSPAGLEELRAAYRLDRTFGYAQ